MRAARLRAATAAVAATMAVGAPNWHACLDEAARALPYCDVGLPVERRLDDLLSRMTLEEKVQQIAPQPDLGDACTAYTRGKKEIGLPPYMWLVETNSAVDAACLQPGKCQTQFVGPVGFGATFNRTAWRLKGSVLGTEMRALHNIGGTRFRRGGSALIGLTAFGPNINIARDPRFGRNSELPGEDPFLSGTYAFEMVSGMQERDSKGYPKVIAFLKHFTAYSTDANRMHADFNVSTFDYFDTYLPQYERAYRAAPAGVMCSYASVNGRPSCANDWLLNKVLRGWSPDAIVTTDCGAVKNLIGDPVRAPGEAHAAAYALMNGSDLEMGDNLFRQLPRAIQQGLATEARVDEAARRLFRAMFKVGRFDPPNATDWSKFDLDDLNSTYHQAVSYDAALQSLVLLKNEGGALPLKVGLRLAVLGPQAVTRAGLFEDYAGDEICFTARPGRPSFGCVQTIGEALAAANSGGTTAVEEGVDVAGNSTTGIGPALDAAKGADVVVLVLGIDKPVEHEGIDRTDTALPGLQEDFALKVLSLQKPTVLVLTNGGALAFDALVNQGGAAPYAIVEAFNPALSGPRALAASLFGRENRWGKLPITIYPHSFIREKAMTDYDMSSPPGRTYRYYTGVPLFPFGWGLSLTEFSLSCASPPPSTAPAPTQQRYECVVRNVGAVDGDEVVLVYHAAADIGRVRHPLPRRALVDFARVRCRAGAEAAVAFEVGEEQLKVVDGRGRRVLYPGRHSLIFSRGHGEEARFDVVVPPPPMEATLVV